MKRPRRNHASAFKAKVALDAFKGVQTLAQLAERFDVHRQQITQWKAQVLERAGDVLATAAQLLELSRASVYYLPRATPPGDLGSNKNLGTAALSAASSSSPFLSFDHPRSYAVETS